MTSQEFKLRRGEVLSKNGGREREKEKTKKNECEEGKREEI